MSVEGSRKDGIGGSEIARVVFDRAAAGIGLIILAPLLIVVAVAAAAIDGLPIFFRQRRIGRFGRPFTLLKFRSMQAAPGPRITVAGDGRVTPLGRVLRRYKIDEIPQLWNVVRGEMSLVGPRPELPEYIEAADPRRQFVLDARPGITDLASLLYRDEEEILARSANPECCYREHILPDKLRLNLVYLEHRRFGLDVKLIALAIWYSLLPNRFDSERVGIAIGVAANREPMDP